MNYMKNQVNTNILRARLGPDLIFVILSMDKEEVRKRVTARHGGQEQAADSMEVRVTLCRELRN